jgi:hypothetical protein
MRVVAAALLAYASTSANSVSWSSQARPKGPKAVGCGMAASIALPPNCCDRIVWTRTFFGAYAVWTAVDEELWSKPGSRLLW